MQQSGGGNTEHERRPPSDKRTQHNRTRTTSETGKEEGKQRYHEQHAVFDAHARVSRADPRRLVVRVACVRARELIGKRQERARDRVGSRHKGSQAAETGRLLSRNQEFSAKHRARGAEAAHSTGPSSRQQGKSQRGQDWGGKVCTAKRYRWPRGRGSRAAESSRRSACPTRAASAARVSNGNATRRDQLRRAQDKGRTGSVATRARSGRQRWRWQQRRHQIREWQHPRRIAKSQGTLAIETRLVSPSRTGHEPTLRMHGMGICPSQFSTCISRL